MRSLRVRTALTRVLSTLAIWASSEAICRVSGSASISTSTSPALTESPSETCTEAIERETSGYTLRFPEAATVPVSLNETEISVGDKGHQLHGERFDHLVNAIPGHCDNAQDEKSPFHCFFMSASKWGWLNRSKTANWKKCFHQDHSRAFSTSTMSSLRNLRRMLR